MKGPFFYQHEDRQVGPLSVTELKQHAATGQLHPNDRIWNSEKPAGFKASDIKNLFPVSAVQQMAEDIAPIDHSTTPPPISADPSNESIPPPAVADVEKHPTHKALRIGTQVLKRVGTEIVLTARACAAEAARLFSFMRSWHVAKSAERHELSTLEAFGQKLEAAGLGDAALRSQVEQLRERRRNVEAAKASTKQLDHELRGLFVRLATPFLESAAPPVGLEKDHEALLRVRESRAGAQTQHQQQRLFPDDSASRLRVIGGSCVALLAFWFVVGRVVSNENESKVPRTKAKDEQELWWEENEGFPRRLAVGKFVGDKPDGEIKLYDEQRRLMARLNFKNGELHGKCTMYYPSGKKFQEGNFIDDKRQGTHRVWFDNGQLAQTLECREGLSHGDQIMYYDDGSKFTEGRNVRGQLDGELKGYLPDGRLAHTSMYSKGKIVSEKDHIECTQDELAIINQRSVFPLDLKSHWQPESSGGSLVDLNSGQAPQFQVPSSSGSQQSTCTNCYGTGQANCLQCFGSGKRTCFNCNGSGRTVNNMQCFQCNGTGQQNCSFCQYGKVQCPECLGLGRR